MHDPIYTVHHYKGKIHGWDVVNEALNDDGILRQSPWMQIISEDYIKIFEYTHETDPSAEFYYNDYGLDWASTQQIDNYTWHSSVLRFF